MGNTKKSAIRIPKVRVSQYLFLLAVRYYLKISLVCSKFGTKKTEMLKIWNLNFSKEESIDERTIPLKFFTIFSNKILLIECILPICNNLSEQNCFDKTHF